MIIRALTRLRAFAFATLVLFLAVALPAAPARSDVPYRFTDGNEGDPGDGVLDPSADAGGGGSSGDRATSIAVSTAVTSWSDADCITLILPQAGTGRALVLRLPRAWWRAAPSGAGGGRWHDAP